MDVKNAARRQPRRTPGRQRRRREADKGNEYGGEKDWGMRGGVRRAASTERKWTRSETPAVTWSYILCQVCAVGPPYKGSSETPSCPQPALVAPSHPHVLRAAFFSLPLLSGCPIIPLQADGHTRQHRILLTNLLSPIPLGPQDRPPTLFNDRRLPP